jgi:hypothetical protein
MEPRRLRFEEIRRLLLSRSTLSLDVSASQLPAPGDIQAPSRPFWYSQDCKSPPVLIETARDVAAALETLNIASWASTTLRGANDNIRGLLVSPLHPAARQCRWSVSSYLLATPSASLLFLDHIAVLGRTFVQVPEPEAFQNRLRLSRIKVTGP